jgi:hypothetical protein
MNRVAICRFCHPMLAPWMTNWNPASDPISAWRPMIAPTPPTTSVPPTIKFRRRRDANRSP